MRIGGWCLKLKMEFVCWRSFELELWFRIEVGDRFALEFRLALEFR